jgi:hypothetical protein
VRVQLYLGEETELYHGHEPAYRLTVESQRPALAGYVSMTVEVFNRYLMVGLVRWTVCARDLL